MCEVGTIHILMGGAATWGSSILRGASRANATSGGRLQSGCDGVVCVVSCCVVGRESVLIGGQNFPRPVKAQSEYAYGKTFHQFG
jgi:hypothetical protein